MLDEKSKNLIGHKDNLDLIFKSYFNNKLHHSIICYGNKGIGKSTFCINLINNIFNKIQSQGKLEYNSNLIYKNTHPNVKLISKQFDDLSLIVTAALLSRINSMRLSGMSTTEVRKVLIADLITGGRIFGQLRNGVKRISKNAIEEAGNIASVKKFRQKKSFKNICIILIMLLKMQRWHF